MHKVTEIALEEEGYLEKSYSAYKKDPSVLYKKTEGAGEDNYTKYGKEMHDVSPSVMDFPAYWCDAFVDWCMYKAYGKTAAIDLLCGGFDDYTKNSINYYKSRNRFILAQGAEPKEGDQIFFSSNGEFTGVYHTGLVYHVDANYVYTIEGNTSQSQKVIPNGGAVCKKQYSRTAKSIYGYGRPEYEKYEKTEDYYVSGDVFYVDEYVTPDTRCSVRSTGMHTTADTLLIREQPDFTIREIWYHTDRGYISAYRVEGWVCGPGGWWYERHDHKYPRCTGMIIDGEEYHFDQNGYMITNDRIAQNGSILY